MIDLVILACLAAHPDHCRIERLATVDDVSLCRGQMTEAVQAWAVAHPQWMVAGLSCRPHEEAA